MVRPFILFELLLISYPTGGLWCAGDLALLSSALHFSKVSKRNLTISIFPPLQAKCSGVVPLWETS